MNILCTGDIHIGRRPTRLPDHVEVRLYSAAAAWDRVVQYAMDHHADALIVTGDIVDRDNRFFEAYGPLEQGLRRLAEHHIEAFAVAGNHDFDVLPRLIDSVGKDRFHLLGQGGCWERFTLQRNGGTIYLDGWSFPEEQVRWNPLERYDRPHHGDRPDHGSLHGELDQPEGRYGPLHLADLESKPVAAWLLGHIHAPTKLEKPGRPLILYPGSPRGLDPGEMGIHGPWWIQIHSPHSIQVRQIPLARAQYEKLEIDLTGVDQPGDLPVHIIESIRSHLDQTQTQSTVLDLLICRLRLTGRTRLHRKLEPLLKELKSQTLSHGTISLTFEDKLEIATRPAIDLEQLAGSRDAPGALAHLLLSLQQNQSSPENTALIEKTQTQLAEVYRARPYTDLQSFAEEPPDRESARQYLIRQGMLLLDEMLAQKEARA
jgi:DNA repair exonuclease SbcCD nuclease subunit